MNTPTGQNPDLHNTQVAPLSARRTYTRGKTLSGSQATLLEFWHDSPLADAPIAIKNDQPANRIWQLWILISSDICALAMATISSGRAWTILIAPAASLLTRTALVMAGRIYAPVMNFGNDSNAARRARTIESEKILAADLKDRPELRSAWYEDHNLKHDTRVTFADKYIRECGIDKSPQMLNIRTGEISLVSRRLA